VLDVYEKIKKKMWIIANRSHGNGNEKSNKNISVNFYFPKEIG